MIAAYAALIQVFQGHLEGEIIVISAVNEAELFIEKTSWAWSVTVWRALNTSHTAPVELTIR